jgi:hypothetical protein
MCDYCSCRSKPVIEGLGADHEDLLTRAGQVRSLIDAGERAAARAELDELLDRLRVHTAVEEASVFVGLRAAGELVDHVEKLAAEHHDMWAVTAALDVDGPGWDEAVRQLLDDLHAHIADEEYDLFPAANIAIALGGWDEIEVAAAEVRAHAA